MASVWLARSLTLVGLLYAVYRSFKVLKQPPGPGHDAETNRMLMLWVTLAFNSMFEQYGEFAISWAPFYYELKCGVLVWLLLPQSSGPGWAFNTLVHPLVQHLRVRLHRDVKPVLARVSADSLVGSQSQLLQSTMSGLGVQQLKHVEEVLAAQVQALKAERARRAQGGAVPGAALLAEATPPGDALPPPRSAVRSRSASLSEATPPAPGKAGEDTTVPPPPLPQQGGESFFGALSTAGSRLASDLGLARPSTAVPQQGEAESKKDR